MVIKGLEIIDSRWVCNRLQDTKRGIWMNSLVQFRRAVLSDCREIAAVKRRIWETTYRGIYPDAKIDGYDMPAQEEKFASIVRNGKMSLYVAEKDGNLLGYMCYGENFRKAFGKTNEILLLYVLKEYQGQGIGRRFFQIARDGLRAMGCKEFLIACNKYNVPAQDFYRAMGGRLIQTDEDNPDCSIPQVYFAYSLED